MDKKVINVKIKIERSNIEIVGIVEKWEWKKFGCFWSKRIVNLNVMSG